MIPLNKKREEIMKIEYFGWITKGHFEVTTLDRCIGLVEVLILLAVIFLPLSYYEVNNRKRKRRYKL